MTTKQIVLVALTLAFVATTAPMSPAHAARSEVFDVDPNTQALIAREKSKQKRNQRRSARKSGGGASSEDCGSVNIGNNDTNTGARGRLNPRQRTVVVVGDIINTADCR